MPLLLQPEIPWYVKSITGFMPLSQSKPSRRLQGIPSLDESITKGHYTNFNLVFKASMHVCNAAPNCYHISNERPLGLVM